MKLSFLAVGLVFAKVLALPLHHTRIEELLLQNRFTDFEGNDIPIHFTQNAPFTVHKRTSTLITCGPSANNGQYKFELSVCNRPSAQAWVCEYSDPNDKTAVIRKEDSCGINQICVDGITNTVQGHEGPVAYCADIGQAYVEITPELIWRLGDNPLRWYYGGLTGKSHALEAVFAGVDPSQPVTLESLNVTAESSSGQFSTIKPLSFNACTECSSLGVQPIPDNTASAAFRFTLPAGTTEARMFFWTI